jgi:proteasome maturation protein
VARLYGIAAAMRLKTEKEIMASCRRAPYLPSSFVGLETVLGTDETIEFEDFMNGELVSAWL